MVKERQDITGLNCIKGASGKVIVDDKGIKDCRGVYGLRLRSSIFWRRACVYSKIFPDIPLVGPNAISKKSNNVVISSPRVFMFPEILVPEDSFPHMWSRDLELFRFGRQGAPKNFFQTRFSRQPLEQSPKFFQGRVPLEGLYVSSGGHGGRASNLGARPPKVKFFYFFCGTFPGAGGRNLSYGYHSNGGPLWCLKFKKKFIDFFSRKLSSKFLGAWHFVEFAPLGGFCPPTDPCRFWS